MRPRGRPQSASPNRQLAQQEFHDDALLRRIDDVIAGQNPYSGIVEPARLVRNTSAHLYKNPDAAQHVRPNYVRRQIGAQINFDTFFEFPKNEPVFSKTNVRQLTKPSNIQEMIKAGRDVYGQSKSSANALHAKKAAPDEQNDTVFMTEVGVCNHENFAQKLLEVKANEFTKREKQLEGPAQEVFYLKKQYRELSQKLDGLRAANADKKLSISQQETE